MEILIDKDIDSEFRTLLNDEGIKLVKKPVLNLDSNLILEYLTVGGGIAAIAKCILEYLKLHFQKRRVVIKLKDSTEIEVEGKSIKEIEILLKTAEKVTVSKYSESKDEKTEANKA